MNFIRFFFEFLLGFFLDFVGFVLNFCKISKIYLRKFCYYIVFDFLEDFLCNLFFVLFILVVLNNMFIIVLIIMMI